MAHEAPLDSRLLLTQNVYILDNFTDLWVWRGRSCSRLVFRAADRLCANLLAILPRSSLLCSKMFHVVEGNEPMVFRSIFDTWSEQVALDTNFEAKKARVAATTTVASRVL